MLIQYTLWERSVKRSCSGTFEESMVEVRPRTLRNGATENRTTRKIERPEALITYDAVGSQDSLIY